MELPHEVNEHDYNAGINNFMYNLYSKMIPLVNVLEQNPLKGRYVTDESYELSLYQNKPGDRMSSAVLADACEAASRILKGTLDTPVKENLEFVIEKAKPVIVNSINSEL